MHPAALVSCPVCRASYCQAGPIHPCWRQPLSLQTPPAEYMLFAVRRATLASSRAPLCLQPSASNNGMGWAQTRGSTGQALPAQPQALSAQQQALRPFSSTSGTAAAPAGALYNGQGDHLQQVHILQAVGHWVHDCQVFPIVTTVSCALPVRCGYLLGHLMYKKHAISQSC